MEVTESQLIEQIRSEKDDSKRMNLIMQLSKLKKSIKRSSKGSSGSNGSATVKIGRGIKRTQPVGSDREVIPLGEARILQDWRDARIALDFSKKCGFYESTRQEIIDNHERGELLIRIYEGQIKGFPKIILSNILKEKNNPED